MLGVLVAIEPLGTLFVNAIRMTVIPLVMCTLIVAVGSITDTRRIGRIGGLAVALFIVLLLVASIASLLLALQLFGGLPVDAALSSSLRAGDAASADAAAKAPTFTQWLVDLVPTNPVRAAADGAMLPLIVFSLVFGLAAARLDDDRRHALVGGFKAIVDVMLTVVRGVVWCAPVGVFALAVPLAARMGAAAAGALASYVVVSVLLIVALSALVLYPAAVIFGRMPLTQFARGCAPAQAVAFSARSALAALPVLIEAGRDRLRLAPELTGFVIPFGVSLFRYGTAIQQSLGVAFLANLYGLPMDPTRVLTVVLTVVVTSFSVPSIPGGSVIAMVPVLLAAQLPVEAIGILIAIDAIPDMFRTAANATGAMTVAVILRRTSAEPQVSLARIGIEA